MTQGEDYSLYNRPETTGHGVTDAVDRGPSRQSVWKMFDRIADRYDFLNHLLSFNRDKYWRRKMSEYLPPGDDLSVLDLATGTADQLISLSESSRVKSGLGLDLSENMLEIGRKKIDRLDLADRLSLKTGDAGAIPECDNEFDAVTMSFGIRNVVDVPTVLREMHRVLKPGGRALILEFSLPKNKLFRRLHLGYLRYVLPHLGRVISGDASAYRYLNQTIESFPHGDAFVQLMVKAGFRNAEDVPLTLGVVSIYAGEK